MGTLKEIVPTSRRRIPAWRWVEVCAVRLKLRWSFLDRGGATSLAGDLAARPGWLDRDPTKAADAFVDTCDHDEPRPRIRRTP